MHVVSAVPKKVGGKALFCLSIILCPLEPERGELRCIGVWDGREGISGGWPDGRQTKYPWSASFLNFSAGLYFMLVY